MQTLKSTREIANDLISVGELRPERVLEMEQRGPKWVVAFYVRLKAWRAAYKNRL